MKILLDAGHGGKDPGAVSIGNIEEEDIALDVILKFGKLLESELGFEVDYTRIDDTYISPSARLVKINNYNPDVFISVHCNSSSNSQACGVETFYRDEYDLELATCVQEALIEATGLKDRGIKSDVEDLGRRLAILNNLTVPAILVEIGFISNPEDLRIIQNTDLIAEAIMEGINRWA